jgi:hypothetical protein
MMKLTRVCCLLLICCAAQGCAEFKQGFIEGQQEQAISQIDDLIDKGVESVKLGDAKFAEAVDKLDTDLAGARALADEASEAYRRAGEHMSKAAFLADYSGGLAPAGWVKDYHRAKAAQYRNFVERMKLRRTQVAAFAVSKSSEEAKGRLWPLTREMDKLTVEGQQLQEKVSRIEAEHNVAPAATGGK